MENKKTLAIIFSLILLILLSLYVMFNVMNGKFGGMETWRKAFAYIGTTTIVLTAGYLLFKLGSAW
mgnify:CR=1 FL=1